MPTVLVKKMNENLTSPSEGKKAPTLFKGEIDLGVTLYEGLKEAGCQLPHGCLAGSCGSCRILVYQGAELLEPAMVIEKDTIESLKETYGQQFALSCSQEGIHLRMACRAKIKREGKLIISPLK